MTKYLLFLLTLALWIPVDSWAVSFCQEIAEGKQISVVALSDEEVLEEAEIIDSKIGMQVREKDYKKAIARWSVITFDHLSDISTDGPSKVKILKEVYEEFRRLLKTYYKEVWTYHTLKCADGSMVFHGSSGKMVVISMDGDIYYDSYSLNLGIEFKMIRGSNGLVPDYTNLRPWGEAPVIQN